MTISERLFQVMSEKGISVPDAELLEFQYDGVLLVSPGDYNENGTEIGTVVESGWEGWDNN